jgi:hypothetical protein
VQRQCDRDHCTPSPNYSLTGPLNKRAIDIGLANARWYRTEIPRTRIRELMQRSDGPATRDTILWIGGMILTGGLGAYFWGSWWCAPFFFIYGMSGVSTNWTECMTSGMEDFRLIVIVRRKKMRQKSETQVTSSEQFVKDTRQRCHVNQVCRTDEVAGRHDQARELQASSLPA